ncbi:MAG TPA: phosphatidate cytidylyltransferase [Firmicutes bacterium]|jgi:phosphatidate cytidylyltransferase|nr:phosphatidate cytidylyltransferase [Bacillota bacterium]
MTKRIITGITGAALLILLVIKGGLFFAAAVGLIIAAGVWEYSRLAGAYGREADFLLLLSLSLLYFLGRTLSLYTSWFPADGLTGIALLLCLFFSFLLALRKYDRMLGRKGLLTFFTVHLFGLVYPGILLTYAVMIRAFAPPLGTEVLLLVFAVVWLNDTGAYFTGLWVGRKKLAPNISPGKTVEGAVGGILAGTVGGILFGALIGLPFSWLLFAAPVFCLLGQLGDLFESLLKRGAGVKDSGNLLPGHGGILDRFDSLLFVLPLAYYLLNFL